MRIVKSIRIKEELWENLRALSKEDGKHISDIVEESIKEYLAKRNMAQAIEKLQQLPGLSLGGEPISREDIYEDRY